AVGSQARVAHRDAGDARLALAGEGEEGRRDLRPVGRRATLQFILRQPREEAAREAFREAAVAAPAGTRHGGDDGTQGIGRSRGSDVHGARSRMAWIKAKL